MKKIYLILTALVLVLPVVSLAHYNGTWSDPLGAPPSRNAEAPINVSGANQYKDGGLAIGTKTSGIFRALYKVLIGGADNEQPSKDLKLDVEGKVGAMAYCDNKGDNCVTSTSIGGGSHWLLNGNILSPKVAGNTVKVSRLNVQGGSWTTNGNDIFLNTGASGQNIFLRPNGDGNPAGQAVLYNNGKLVATDFCLPTGKCLSQMTSGGGGGDTTIINPPPPPPNEVTRLSEKVEALAVARQTKTITASVSCDSGYHIISASPIPDNGCSSPNARMEGNSAVASCTIGNRVAENCYKFCSWFDQLMPWVCRASDVYIQCATQSIQAQATCRQN